MLTDITQDILSKAMDAGAMRNRAITNNIANVDTPGYRRQNVSFESELRSALENPSPVAALQDRQLQDVEARMTGDVSSPDRENGNNVDADKEMAGLAQNTVHYQALLQTFNMKDAMLRSAIHDGGK